MNDILQSLFVGFLGGIVGSLIVTDIRRRLTQAGETKSLGPSSGLPLAAGTRHAETPMGTFSGRKLPRPPPEPVEAVRILR